MWTAEQNAQIRRDVVRLTVARMTGAAVPVWRLPRVLADIIVGFATALVEKYPGISPDDLRQIIDDVGNGAISDEILHALPGSAIAEASPSPGRNNLIAQLAPSIRRIHRDSRRAVVGDLVGSMQRAFREVYPETTPAELDALFEGLVADVMIDASLFETRPGANDN